MKLFSKLADFLTGGLGSKIVDKVLDQIPDRLSVAEKADFRAAVVQATRNHEIELLKIANEQDEITNQSIQDFNQRIRDMEGTAKDLQQFGVLGKIIVFLRGMQRPVWGFAVLGLDYKVFSGQWNITSVGSTAQWGLDDAFWLINFLVLGFLFGERALKNVLPNLPSKRVAGEDPK